MAFNTAVSGLTAASTNLEIIGNNVANAGTTGYKSARGEFADVYASSQLGAAANAIGKGVSISGVTQSFTQGNISFTNNVLDMAINGGGFFLLNDSGSNVYSRAGNFQVDNQGFVVNPLGNRLQVFNTTDTGAQTGGVGDLLIDTSLIQPSGTEVVEFTANVDSRDLNPVLPFGTYDAFAVPPTAPVADEFNSSTSVTIYDSLGNSHVMSTYFERSASNQWNVHTLIDGVSQGAATPVEFLDTGAIKAGVGLNTSITVAGWSPKNASGDPTGAADQTFVVDLSDITQFGAEFAVTDVQQDGFSTGQLSGIEVGDSGVVFARFTNGQSRSLGQVALSTFTNANGLQPLGGSRWAETFISGQPIISTPGLGGVGLVQSGALEESNVEVSQELVNMIVAQRNFQANAKMIQTEDTITQTVINLR